MKKKKARREEERDDVGRVEWKSMGLKWWSKSALV